MNNCQKCGGELNSGMVCTKCGSNQNIRSIESQTPYKVSEVICVRCFYRYLSVRPIKTLLKELECRQCKSIESIIETGEDMDIENTKGAIQ